MVARCSNPACNREFRELSKGRLFLLPPIRRHYSNVNGKVEKLSDYCYWLCPECDVTHTITRLDSEVMVIERAPGTPYPPLPTEPRSKGLGQVRFQRQSQAG